MYILDLGYYKSPESKYPDEHFEFDYLKGLKLDFAEKYNLQEDKRFGELDYRRATTKEEVLKWLEDGIIGFYPSQDSKKFIVLADPSPRLEISVYYWQSGYD